MNNTEPTKRDESLTDQIATLVQQARIGECTAHEVAEQIVNLVEHKIGS